MKEIIELEQNVALVKLDGREIYLIGTAHISQSSVCLVEESIERFKPETVCVELCDSRAQALNNPDRWRNMDIFNVLRQGKGYLLLAQLLLVSFQKKIALKLKLRPGEEMMAATRAAQKNSAAVINIDREIKITLKRAWAKTSFISMSRVLSTMVEALFSAVEVSQEDIEKLKYGDSLSDIMTEFTKFLPELKEVLIDERDRYMAGKITVSPGSRLLAVMGAGHIPGVKAALGSIVDFASLEEQPKKSLCYKLTVWGLFAALLMSFIYVFTLTGQQSGKSLLGSWALITGSCGALATALALPHPLTVASAFVAAPFMCLHPAHAVGLVAALVEAFLHRPQVKDFEQLTEQPLTLKSFWQNRVSKILLILLLGNIGGAIGLLLGGLKIFTSLP